VASTTRTTLATIEPEASSTKPPGHRPPSCLLSQLRATFTGAEPGAGNIIAAIDLWNPGAVACQLDHPVLLLALDAAGHPAHRATVLRSAPTSPSLVLTERTAAPSPGSEVAAGHTTAVVLVIGDYRDGPAPDGSCPPGDEVRPASWKLTLGRESILVPNSNPHSPNGPGGAEACLGAFHVHDQSSG
jgi:hypothetical protein